MYNRRACPKIEFVVGHPRHEQQRTEHENEYERRNEHPRNSRHPRNSLRNGWRRNVDLQFRDDSGAKRGGIVTRAAVGNAFTRYAHEGQGDAQAEVAIQRAASGLLWGRGTAAPAPLPYIALS